MKKLIIGLLIVCSFFLLVSSAQVVNTSVSNEDLLVMIQNLMKQVLDLYAKLQEVQSKQVATELQLGSQQNVVSTIETVPAQNPASTVDQKLVDLRVYDLQHIDKGYSASMQCVGSLSMGNSKLIAENNRRDDKVFDAACKQLGY